MFIDLAIIETGNGGDLQLVGNDLAVVTGVENMPYLGMFGGNVEAVTTNRIQDAQSFDYWQNNLFMPNNQSVQFNSIVEKTLNTTPLTSAGRVIIENAIKKDLEFLTSAGALLEVTVTIVSTDRINVTLKVQQPLSAEKVTIINFKKKADGDWYIFDFNNDFFL